MRQNQQGSSYLGYTLVLLVVFIALKVIVAVWPAYWDDYSINKQIIATLKIESTALSPQQFSSKMNESFGMNNIRELHFDDRAKVSKKDGQIQVNKHYEVRSHLFLNIDLILSFEKFFDQRTV